MKAYSFLLFCIICLSGLKAQIGCPINIGFENGDFTGWEVSAGSIEMNSGILSLSPSSLPSSSHTIYKASANPELDFYGNFPVTCPNGSAYSIKLGNNAIGRGAESISYTFTVPANQNEYSLIYNFAVVFENPSHEDHQQPRFTAKVYDGATGAKILCSSFDFVASGSLPGFQLSSKGANVFYRPWSPVTIKLVGYQGKQLRLEFTTNDCSRGGHFGYAYIDANEKCTSLIAGNAYCEGDTAMLLSGSPGFSGYKWYANGFNNLIGTTDILSVSPPLPKGTRIALEVTPYLGAGCLDTLYTTVKYSPERLNLNLQPSVESCIEKTVDITSPKFIAGIDPTLSISYFSDSRGLNYLSFPSAVKPGNVYYVKAENDFGCQLVKPIEVIAVPNPVINVTDPVPVKYPGSIDITKSVLPASNITHSFWYDKNATRSIPFPMRMDTTGTYYVKAIIPLGCYSIAPVKVNILPPPEAEIDAPNAFSPNKDGINDRFVFKTIGYITLNTFKIFNRWGQPVYETKDITKFWDGTLNGNPLPVGTYYWVFNGIDTYWLKQTIKSGSVTIVK